MDRELPARLGSASVPYELDPSGVDESYTESLMAYCRTVLGSRCVLQNSSIRTPLLAGWYTPMYAAIAAQGAPLSFQTAAPGRVGDLDATVRWAVSIGAGSVELPLGHDRYGAARLAAWEALFRVAGG